MEMDVNEAPPVEDNAYDSVKPSEPPASTSKSSENTLPPVYAAVDKGNKGGKPVRISLKSSTSSTLLTCSVGLMKTCFDMFKIFRCLKFKIFKTITNLPFQTFSQSSTTISHIKAFALHS